MQQTIKNFLWILLLASGLQTSWAYSPAGPIGNGGDAWQVPAIGYGIGGDLNAPKNIGEEYRRNTPVMYYAYDANFLGFFGPEGATAVDGTFAILNALTNVDNYSKALSEFSLDTRHANYQAQALGLLDLKSSVLGLMVEQLGLADPVRYTWTLHDRAHVGSIPCPVGMLYWVVQRNFDYISSPLNQLQYSPYVNNTLYTYQIFEGCTTIPAALAVPFSVDPLATTYSPVASFSLFLGDYYSGLTRDDMAGLRYLLSTNNINWETPAGDALLIVTNTTQQLFPVSTTTNGGVLFNGTVYGTESYGALVSFAQTNDPATVQAAFPGVQVTVVSNYFATVLVTNTIAYFTNYYGEPAGTAPHLVVTTSVSTAIVEFFVDTFDNIITNVYKTNTVSKLQTITVGPANGAPVGSPPQTNTVTKLVTNNIPYGEFYILPTNSPCGVDIISTLVTFTNFTTNVLVSTVSTNDTSTNTGSSYTQILVTPSLAHVYVIHPVTCLQSNAITGLYRGIGNIKFVRADYDSLLGQYWQPVTNDYSMVLITNSKASIQHFRRIVTTPDFLFSATDLGPGVFGTRNLDFDTANVLPGLAGPGTITPFTEITLNKIGPAYFNSSEDVMDGTPYFNQTPGGDITDFFYSYYFIWSAYDGTTNDPVVFPNGTSIENLQNQVLIQVSPTSPLPVGYVDVDYAGNNVTFSATGGAFTRPFTWTASGLPGGLSLDSSTGTLSGVPTQSGTFDFTLTLTDYVGRSVQWIYTITIQ